MSDQHDMTIEVAITTRAQMNSATPRFGSWTYHHVLPVRLYFLIAWTIIRTCKHPNSWQSTRTVGRQSLLSMCQNTPNKEAMRLYLDQLESSPDGVADMARLCASPPFGGFAGPNPSQRDDDPHDGVERFPPASAPAVWWGCMRTLGETIRDAYALHAMPQPNTVVSATKKVADWCLVVETLGSTIGAAAESGGPGFDASDWTPHDGGAWTILRGPGSAGNARDPLLHMKLRGRAAQPTYSANPPAGAWRLKQVDDLLTIPPPPLAAPGGGGAAAR